MNNYEHKEEGIVEVSTKTFNNKNDKKEIESTNEENITSNPLKEDKEGRGGLLPFEVTPALESVQQVDIRTIEAFNEIRESILKSYYVYLFIRDKTLSLVTDTKLYFIIDLNTIKVEQVAKLLQYRKPKKIVVGIEEYKDFILESTTSFWDLRFVLKILWDIDIKSAKDLLEIANIPREGKKNIYLFSKNLIRIAKELNIFIELNKMNNKLMLELDTLKQAIICEKKGIPIDLNLYEKYKQRIKNDYDKTINVMADSYGQEFSFEDSFTILKYLKDQDLIVSLEPSILEKECLKLFNDLQIYRAYNLMKKHQIKDEKFYLKHNIYSGCEITVYLEPDNEYMGTEEIFVSGVYNDLYLRVLTELTKDTNLIEATSTNEFLNFTNSKILGDKKLGIYTEMFIRAYANRNFKSFEIQRFAEEHYKTVISDDDVDYINKLFQNKISNLYKFFLSFNGEDVIYERYNKNIFQPNTNLDCYIKQIMSLVFKTSISFVQSAIDEYIAKYKNDDTMNIELISFYDYKIVLSTTLKSKPVAIDILNRYMALAYKKYIINTKYYNITSVIANDN